MEFPFQQNKNYSNQRRTKTSKFNNSKKKSSKTWLPNCHVIPAHHHLFFRTTTQNLTIADQSSSKQQQQPQHQRRTAQTCSLSKTLDGAKFKAHTNQIANLGSLKLLARKLVLSAQPSFELLRVTTASYTRLHTGGRPRMSMSVTADDGNGPR